MFAFGISLFLPLRSEGKGRKGKKTGLLVFRFSNIIFFPLSQDKEGGDSGGGVWW
jgi:hypothetical protein